MSFDSRSGSTLTRNSITSRRHEIPPTQLAVGMVSEPQRSFRLHVSRLFQVRSLSDFMREDDTWPTQQDFVERHIDYTLMSTTLGKQVKWLKVLYTEATQIVERLCTRYFV